MRIIIETIPHEQQRYPTCGDWQFEHDGTLHIKVSEMGCWRSELDVAIHEAIESLLCQEAGITDMQVTQFDIQFEREREAGKHALTDEPGDDSRSPYKTHHEAATFAERACASALGLDWIEHCRTVNNTTS